MDGIVDPAPGGAPLAAPTATPTWRISSSGMSCLIAATIVLLLLYLTGRFLWQYKKDAAAQSAAAASSSSSRPAPSRSSPSPRARLDTSLLPAFVHMDADQAAECAVCMAVLRPEEDDAGRALPWCGHGFHEVCIATWLRVNNTCPLCRAPVM